VDLEDLSDKAFKLFDRDDPNKHARKAYKEGLRQYRRGNYDEADSCWRSAALGYYVGGRYDSRAKVLCDLGNLAHRQGREPEAEHWFRKAADAGDSAAMFNLGVLRHEQGNDDEAEQWMRRAADAGDPDAMRHVGILLHGQGKESEAEQWRRKAAEAARGPRAWHEGSGMHQGWSFGWKWEWSGGNLKASNYATEMGEKAAGLADDVARGDKNFGSH
jgi:TPR repeat protein